jgi:hypothetical protein
MENIRAFRPKRVQALLHGEEVCDVHRCIQVEEVFRCAEEEAATKVESVLSGLKRTEHQIVTIAHRRAGTAFFAKDKWSGGIESDPLISKTILEKVCNGFAIDVAKQTNSMVREVGCDGRLTFGGFGKKRMNIETGSFNVHERKE